MSFSLGVIDWWICLIVLSFSIFLGLNLAIRKKSSADSASFFLADRSLSWPLVGASLFATNIGAEHLVGLSGDAYRYGLRPARLSSRPASASVFACHLSLSVLFAPYGFHHPRVSGDCVITALPASSFPG